MENNKILIGVKFVTQQSCVDYELYVIRDVKFSQLLDGINYGIEKLKASKEEYSICRKAYDDCIKKENESEHYAKTSTGEQYFRFISLESYVKKNDVNTSIDHNHFRFTEGDKTKSLDELGFISSSVLVFDRYNVWKSNKQELNENEVAEAFKRETGKKNRIEFPEYNISTRQLVTYDTTPVDILPPADPPQNNRMGILAALIPSLISMILMLVYRVAASGGNGGFIMFISVVTGAIGVFTTMCSYVRQKKEYARSIKNWRVQYATYIDKKINEIESRKNEYRTVLEKRYPAFSSFDATAKPPKPIINGNVYSRHPQDADFLAIRLGTSAEVNTPFLINGEKGDTVSSTAFFEWKKTNDGKEIMGVNLLLREEAIGKREVYNLCELPGRISEIYRYMGVETPFLYSMRNKGAVGILDKKEDYTNAKSLVDSMLLDLCYYHSPENLQVILVFAEETNSMLIEEKIKKYKFMPHFRGLIDGVSQFVFNRESANLVYGNMCRLLSERTSSGNSEEEEEPSFKVPHMVFVVLEGNDYGLKEHAIAEYLPKPPVEGNEYVNKLGITFLYVEHYKEYLPAYCNDVITAEKDMVTITPQNGIIKTLEGNGEFSELIEKTKVTCNYLEERVMNSLLDQLSTIYYAKIAENGKVPSIVSMFDLWSDIKEASKSAT